MDIIETNILTGEVTQRNYTAEEKAERDLFIANAKTVLDAEIAANQAIASAKAAILAKIGITEEELKIALG